MRTIGLVPVHLGRLRTFALVAISFGLPSPMLAQRATSVDSSHTFVAVSRREMRVFFAPESASTWGWSAPPDTSYRRTYYWSVTVEGVDGARSLGLYVKRADNLPRTFPSLDSLVRAGNTSFCQPGMMVQCFDAAVVATVENRRVVLTFRDSAAIARMFAQRPESVMTLEDAPTMRGSVRLGTAPVRYVDPQLPRPSAAERDSAAMARRRFEATVNLVSRGIGAELGSGALWVAVGDSLELGVQEWHCVEDSCAPYDAGESAARDWGRWALTDSSVARLYRLGRAPKNWRFWADSERVMTLVGIKPGVVTVRAVGVHTPADTVPTRIPVDSILQAEVLVTPPIGRLEITPRPTSMIAGDSTTVTVRVLDRSGRPIEGAPVELLWGGQRSHDAQRSYDARPATEPVKVGFSRPGRYEIVANLGVHTDTVNVEVVAPRR